MRVIGRKYFQKNVDFSAQGSNTIITNSVSTNQKSGFQNTYVSKILAHDPALDDE